MSRQICAVRTRWVQQFCRKTVTDFFRSGLIMSYRKWEGEPFVSPNSSCLMAITREDLSLDDNQQIYVSPICLPFLIKQTTHVYVPTPIPFQRKRVLNKTPRSGLISLIRADRRGNCQRWRENHVQNINCLWAITHRLGGNKSQLKLGLAWWICFLSSHTKWNGDSQMDQAEGRPLLWTSESVKTLRPLVRRDSISCFASLGHSQKAYGKITLTNYLSRDENL